MTVLPVVALSKELLMLPETFLRKNSKEINYDELETRALVEILVRDMFETMYASPWGGVGLAAPQVGVLWRLVVIDFGNEPLIAINPKIVYATEELTDSSEVCLSLPFMVGDVKRHESITVEYLNYHGNVITKEETGFRARVFQHEIDHLDGVLYVDRLNSSQTVRDIELPSLRNTKKAMNNLVSNSNQS